MSERKISRFIREAMEPGGDYKNCSFRTKAELSDPEKNFVFYRARKTRTDLIG